MRRNALSFLWMISAALAAILIVIWILPNTGLKNVRWRAPEPIVTEYLKMLPVMPERNRMNSSQLMTVLERPIFSSTRRPAPPLPAQAAAAPVDNLSTARLSGIFQGAGGAGIILSIAGKDRRIRLNESVDGWTLQTIQARTATFVSGGEVRVLQLPRADLATFTGVTSPQVSTPPADRATSVPALPSTSPPAQRRPRFGP